AIVPPSTASTAASLAICMLVPCERWLVGEGEANGLGDRLRVGDVPERRGREVVEHGHVEGRRDAALGEIEDQAQLRRGDEVEAVLRNADIDGLLVRVAPGASEADADERENEAVARGIQVVVGDRLHSKLIC